MSKNHIKKGTANDSLSVQQGPFAVGASGLGDYGPSSRTGYYAGIDVPDGGHVFYRTDDYGNITANVAHDDTQAMFFLQSYGATGSTLNEMLSWAAASGNVAGLSVDITASYIASQNSGTSGSSGSSGSGGSSQFPKAWVVNTFGGTSYLEPQYAASTRVLYTRGSTLTNGMGVFYDAGLTQPYEIAYFGNVLVFTEIQQVWDVVSIDGVSTLNLNKPLSAFQNDGNDKYLADFATSSSDLYNHNNTTTIIVRGSGGDYDLCNVSTMAAPEIATYGLNTILYFSHYQYNNGVNQRTYKRFKVAGSGYATSDSGCWIGDNEPA